MIPRHRLLRHKLARPRLLLLLTAAMVALLVVPAVADTADKHSPAPGASLAGIDRAVEKTTHTASAVLADTLAKQRHTLGYWTPERMRAAQSVSGKSMSAQSRSAESIPRANEEPAPGLLGLVPALPQLPMPATTRQAVTASRWSSGGLVARTVGKVFFTLGKTDYVCSATVVSSVNRDTLATAGHCLNAGPGEFAANWIFVPGYDHGAEPYGRWTARRLLATPRWTENGDLNNDYGFAVLNTANGKHIADVVGTQAIAFNSARGQYVYSFGYPALPPYAGDGLYLCQGQAQPDPHGGSGEGVTCDMTEGSSGGPWLTGLDSSGAGTVISVNSFGYDDTPGVMWGPRLDDTARSLYDTAQQS